MKNKSVLMRVVADIGRSRALIAVSLLLSAASVVFNLYIPVLAGDAIDGMTGGKVDMAVITPALIKIFICAVSGGVLQWIMSIINNKIAYDTVKNIRSRAFSHIQRLPVAYIDSHPYGDIVSRVIADAEQFADGLILGFSQLFTGVITIAVTLIFMLTISPVITLIVVVLTPISLFTESSSSISRPATYTLPPSFFNKPQITAMEVLFPAPFSPTRQWISPR